MIDIIVFEAQKSTSLVSTKGFTINRPDASNQPIIHSPPTKADTSHPESMRKQVIPAPNKKILYGLPSLIQESAISIAGHTKGVIIRILSFNALSLSSDVATIHPTAIIGMDLKRLRRKLGDSLTRKVTASEKANRCSADFMLMTACPAMVLKSIRSRITFPCFHI